MSNNNHVIAGFEIRQPTARGCPQTSLYLIARNGFADSSTNDKSIPAV